jgi:hypothetical protein
LETLSDSGETPEDALAAAYRKLRGTLEAELLQQIKESSPAFFEQLVVDLLVKMGYGGSRQDAGRAIGRTGDGGIDGIINEDRLGLEEESMDKLSDSAEWSRTTTLVERIILLQEDGTNELAPQDISERARKCMGRWRSQSPFASGDLFNQRLAADGLTDAMLLRILVQKTGLLALAIVSASYGYEILG